MASQFYLDINNCIILSNSQRLKDKREIIKDKKHLSKMIICNNETSTPTDDDINNYYMKLYRAEKNGISLSKSDFINQLMIFLGVKFCELVKSKDI